LRNNTPFLTHHHLTTAPVSTITSPSNKLLLRGIDQALEKPDRFRQIIAFHRMGFGRSATIGFF
jgi:hypothetical protein